MLSRIIYKSAAFLGGAGLFFFGYNTKTNLSADAKFEAHTSTSLPNLPDFSLPSLPQVNLTSPCKPCKCLPTTPFQPKYEYAPPNDNNNLPSWLTGLMTGVLCFIIESYIIKKWRRSNMKTELVETDDFFDFELDYDNMNFFDFEIAFDPPPSYTDTDTINESDDWVGSKLKQMNDTIAVVTHNLENMALQQPQFDLTNDLQYQREICDLRIKNTKLERQNSILLRRNQELINAGCDLRRAKMEKKDCHFRK